MRTEQEVNKAKSKKIINYYKFNGTVEDMEKTNYWLKDFCESDIFMSYDEILKSFYMYGWLFYLNDIRYFVYDKEERTIDWMDEETFNNNFEILGDGVE